MSQPPPSVSPALLMGGSRLLLLFFLFTAIAVFFQIEEGAYRSEFGGHPDEAAHYVTGLFVRDAVVAAKDYAFSGFAGSPVKVGKEFAQNYYEHYPKIGLGVWPPLFYMVQSALTLPFGPSRDCVLLLMAGLAGLVGTVLFSALEKEFGSGLAFLGGFLWLGLPLVQQYAGMVMAEMLSALLIFAATLQFGKYLDERRTRDAVCFGLLASAAILTKGTGLALAFVPLFAILLTRRFSLLKERPLWIAGGLVVLLAGPWTFATRKLGEGGWEEPHPSLHFTAHALPYYGWKLVVALGVFVGVLALLGVWDRLVRRWRRGPEEGGDFGRWASCLSLIGAVVLFQSIAPAGREARHLVPVIPAAVMFAVAGVAWIKGRLPAGAAPWVAGGVLLVFFGAPMLTHGGVCHGYGSIGDTLEFSPFKICPKDSFGLGSAAVALMESAPEAKGKTFLVSSDATGEGMLIAEVAMHDVHRPRYTAKRASKELAASTWGGGGYRPKFESGEALLAYLTSGAVDFLVVDPAIPERNRRPHHAMLRQVIAAHPESFERLPGGGAFYRGGERMPGDVETYKVRHL